MITLKEAKNYLRVDYEEDDSLIQNLLSTAKNLVMDIGRMDESALAENEDTVRTAMLFALAACGTTPNEADNNNNNEQNDHQAETPDTPYEAPQITELYNKTLTTPMA